MTSDCKFDVSIGLSGDINSYFFPSLLPLFKENSIIVLKYYWHFNKPIILPLSLSEEMIMFMLTFI